MSDTSLVFNLVARDQASGTVSQMGERFTAAAATIGTGFAGALGAGVVTALDMEAAGDKLAAQLGVGPQEAAEISKVAATVYEDAWGDSIETVNAAVRGVYQNIGDTSKAEGGLEGVTTKALALAQTFDEEVGPVTAAVGQLMRTGLASGADEAFDIITAGLQGSANKAGDLLDVLGEYSTQFRRLGLDGQTATGLLSQGLKAGARDADQVSDAVGQFGELALAGGGAVSAAFTSIGLDAETMAKRIGAGGSSATSALQDTLDALRGTEDQTVRLNAATALFGDPGTVMGDALFALDPATAAASSGMDKAAGSTDRLVASVADNPRAQLESFKRTVMTELGEAAGAFLGFASENSAVMVPLGYTLAGLAGTVLVVRGAMMAYAAISSVVTGAHALITASSWGVIGTWLRMNAVGLGVYLRIGAAAVVSGASTAAAWTGSALASIGAWVLAMLRAGATAALQFGLMAARAIVWAATMAAQWLIAMGPIGWIAAAVAGLVALVVVHWDWIKAKTEAIWTAIVDWVKAVPRLLYNAFLNFTLIGLVVKHWDTIKMWTARKLDDLIQYVRGLPSRISSALSGMGTLLVGKGRDLVLGLWNGIRNMGPWLRSTLMAWAKKLIPGPIASALGIHSPSVYMAEHIGRWIPAGVVQGIEAGQPAVARTMAELVHAPAHGQSAAAGKRLTAAGGPLLTRGSAGGQVIVRFEFAGADAAFKTFVQKIVRIDGRGSVQLAFGQG
ncbi:phage tail tape measure protein [Streptomyces sp. NPDC002073]